MPATTDTQPEGKHMNFFSRRTEPDSPIKQISPQDAVAKAKTDDVVILDVRDATELAQTGKAEGAIHIPLFLLQTKGDPRHPEFHSALDTEKPVMIYCASGARSGMAAQILAKNGFKEIYNIGGLGHWVNAGGKRVAG